MRAYTRVRIMRTSACVCVGMSTCARLGHQKYLLKIVGSPTILSCVPRAVRVYTRVRIMRTYSACTVSKNLLKIVDSSGA